MVKKIATIILSAIALNSCAQKKQKNMNVGIPKTTVSIDSNLQVATFGNGCFWCTEAIFQQLNGVEKVVSGYSGGFVENPTYEQVCEKNTGHAEVLQITYNPSVISFDELLEVFWKTHDPTTLNQQGADIGPQYRSVIFYHTLQQQQKAKMYLEALDKSGAFKNPIVTAIEPFSNFYSAEDYHQNYFNNNSNTNGYCRIVIRPKVEKFREVFKSKLKPVKN
jgi:peptide-methionine (S)-S-oxide reductase